MLLAEVSCEVTVAYTVPIAVSTDIDPDIDATIGKLTSNSKFDEKVREIFDNPVSTISVDVTYTVPTYESPSSSRFFDDDVYTIGVVDRSDLGMEICKISLQSVIDLCQSVKSAG